MSNSAVTVCNNSYFHSFLLLSDFAFLYFELLFADVFMYKPVNGLINCNNQFQEPSMSSKTKIFVLKSRNLIWTAVIVVIVILLAVLLASALHLDKNQSRSFPKDMTESASSSIVSSQSFSDTESFTLSGSYIPGRYAASVVLGGDTVDIVVCVDKNHINSIRAHNLAQSVATLYPLVPSVLQSLESQILSSQSLQGVTYSDSSQYTASLLIDAITRALKKSVTY